MMHPGLPGPPGSSGNVPPEIADMQRKISLVYGCVKVLDKKLNDLLQLVQSMSVEWDGDETQEDEDHEDTETRMFSPPDNAT
jgi:hypothetical protein